MNLKYNRIDMKKKNSDVTHSMKLRNRPTTVRRKDPLRDKQPEIKKTKGEKKNKIFGADITNHPTTADMQP